MDLFPDVGTQANSYFAMMVSMMQSISGAVFSSMDAIAPIGSMMNLVFMIISAIFLFHYLTALVKGLQSGTFIGLVGCLFGTFATHGVRLLVFLVLALGAAGVSNVRFRMDGTHAAVKDSLPLQRVVSSWLGTENQFLARPVAGMKTGIMKALTAVEGLKYHQIYEKGKEEIKAAQERAIKASNFDAAKGASDPGMLDKFVTSAVDLILKALFDALADMSFFFTQIAMARALIVNYVFIAFAWKACLHFLPLLVLLAYFRSLQGFLINIAKQMLALTIAAAVVGQLASALYDSSFWLGPSGIIGSAFSGVMITGANAGSNPFEVGSYNWILAKYGAVILSLQIFALFGLIAILLNEIWALVRGAVDGSLRSVYQADLKSH